MKKLIHNVHMYATDRTKEKKKNDEKKCLYEREREKCVMATIAMNI